MIYLIGSLRNSKIPLIANQIREATGEEVFDDWFSPGPTTDDEWQRHEGIRGRNFKEALEGWHARDIFEFDKKHLIRARVAVLASPAGKSAHLELGYVIGMGKPGFIYMPEEPDRFDVMLQFATAICRDMEDLVRCLKWKN